MNNIDTQKLQISHVLNEYLQALLGIEEAKSDVSEQQVLAVLLTRDAVHAELMSKANPIPPDEVTKLMELDRRLKVQAHKIVKVGQLQDWCSSIHPPKEAWWWFLESDEPDPWTRFDAIWDGLTTINLTAVVSFLATFSSQFIVSGLDLLTTFGLVGNGAIALLVFGSLTQSGREKLQKLLHQLKLPERYCSEVSFGISALLLLGAIYLQNSLPQLGKYYYQLGLQSFSKAEFTQAKKDLKQAIAFDSGNFDAHLLLGKTFENLENLPNARTHYMQALPGNNAETYNNLGRLYLGDEDYLTAESFFLRGLDLVKADNFPIRYSLLTNLGWVEIEQNRHGEAGRNLVNAIALNEKQPTHQQRWEANCIFAKVLEIQKDSKGAIAQSTTCVNNASSYTTFDYRWAILARRRLESVGTEGVNFQQK
ncbi:tetratricopeptide repeat protein [Nostoc sp. CCY0012]|uniref:tetratricopeptide repeat protein n=1 Tax=Nostoc sp. CCY0012 TaxID=1056123 RepID=UPI0039C6C698